MTHLKKIEQMAKTNLGEFNLVMHDMHPNYWGSRCVLELQYAYKLSESENGIFDKVVFEATDIAWVAYREEGALTKATAMAVEQALSSLAEKAKGYSLLCIGHAHIDMNWMWGFDETVAITLDTFRTMLDLMNEYPGFTFGQSQASVYRIVEQYCPEMLEEIKQRIRENRWEVTASTWVEADRNMPNLESMARHFLYTKQYLSGLLDIDPASLNIDYEPDTFGHNINVPEVLCDGGVKYYYHCRGYADHVLYNWKAPSGRSILVFREPTWYNWTMDGRCALVLPEFCKKNGLDSMLRVYGVGDHGGGPTRRDIEKIIDMNTWPVFPSFKFGTYGQFFRHAEKNSETLPVVEGELNFIFDGCYTTQTRQKKGNRLGEALLTEAESTASLTELAIGTRYDAKALSNAWKKVLFNQFHDILPGSGTVDTREYAMGQYQEVLAAANTSRMQSVRALSAAADTSAFLVEEDVSLTRSEGAGVGFGLSNGRLQQTGRHAGLRRLFTAYNPLPQEREASVEFSVWDWSGDITRMYWTDVHGDKLNHQVTTSGFDSYWGHLHAEVLVMVRTPGMGYTTVILDEAAPETFTVGTRDPRVDRTVETVLENEYIRAVMDGSDGSIVSLVEKDTGREFVKPGCPMGVFQLVKEDPIRGMSAWTVGRYMDVASLNKGVKIGKIVTGPEFIRQSIEYEKEFGNGSKLTITVSLDRGEKALRFDTTVRWQEIGRQETFYPQLNFHMPVAYDYAQIRYDVPMGIVDRDLLEMDVPAQSFGMPLNTGGSSLMLMSDCKYGYRGASTGLSLTLIRSSVDPDPWPEVGEHHIQMAIAICGSSKTEAVFKAQAFCSKVVVAAARAHAGSMPSIQSLMAFSGDGLILSGVKKSENGDGVILRYYEIEGKAGRGSVKFLKAPVSAKSMNLLEQPEAGQAVVNGNTVDFDFRANGVGNLLVCF